jgi:hypothetical protein
VGVALAVAAAACTGRSASSASSDSGIVDNEAADAGSESGSSAQCAALVAEFDALRAEFSDAANECVSDTDCTVIRPRLYCADSSLQVAHCDIVIAADRVADLQRRTTEIAARACPLVCGYGRVDDCGSVGAKCLSNRCTRVVEARDR